MPNANERHKLQRNDDAKNHGHKIAHAFYGWHKQHGKSQQNQYNGDDCDNRDAFWPGDVCHG
ncbi:MAG: hypothetical protein K0R26_2393 [Bacteroidota bacterium]|nr:hypothetical protein [Bacteroidota bacterium]